MNLRISITALCFCWLTTEAQLNVEFIGNLDYENVLNDIWGYVDGNGTEYALVGMTTGVSIVTLADPANPQEVQFINGVTSTWRDMKTWGDFAYVTADQGQQGLLIIDLSPLPNDTAVYEFWRPDLPGLGFYNRAHNIWIDEFGLAYLAGSNIGGTVIFDVKADPWNPEFLVKMPLDYAHDVYARDSLVYTSEIYLGELRVYDISRLDDIQLLGFTSTPFSFTHNAWLSDDGNSAFTTDERANAFVGSYDVSDPSEIKELDRYRPAATEGMNVIPHNVHVWNDYLIISYYTDGCIIVDASRPDNLVEVGNFDTYPEAPGGYNGAWGAYPFLPSGNILMSDRQHGLFVLGPDYKRACFLEGSVKDSETHLPVQNAEVEIILDEDDHSEVLLPEFADAEGMFKMGKAVPGTFVIKVSHPDYVTKFVSGVFENGVVLQLDIELVKKQQYSVSGRVVTSEGSLEVPYAFVALQGNERFYQTQADENGAYSISQVFEGTYTLYAGNWGKYQISEVDVVDALTDDIQVNDGYYDDFLNDLGWTVTGTSMTAQWERGEPISELLFGAFPCNPGEDVVDDIGRNAYVTGNTGGDAEEDAVVDGFTLLSSPFMDLTGYSVPRLSFSEWVCERLIEQATYFVLVSNGVDTVTLDTITTNNLGGTWVSAEEIDLADAILLTDQMQVHFKVENTNPENIAKGALDKVLIYDAMPNATRNPSVGLHDIVLFPNPSNGLVSVTFGSDDVDMADLIQVVNMYGQTVFETIVNSQITTVDLSQKLSNGVYLVRVSKEGMVVGVGKMIVQ